MQSDRFRVYADPVPIGDGRFRYVINDVWPNGRTLDKVRYESWVVASSRNPDRKPKGTVWVPGHTDEWTFGWSHEKDGKWVDEKYARPLGAYGRIVVEADSDELDVMWVVVPGIAPS